MSTITNLYREHFINFRRERLFLASIAFFVAFGITRIITHLIRDGRGPFHNVAVGGRHIHHLVFGITLLLIVGYLWLAQYGTGTNDQPRWLSRLTAMLYGISAALTLDELALWLTLRDVYWSSEGRLSVDAVILFGAFLFASLWGAPFLRGLFRHLGNIFWNQSSANK